MTEQSTDGTCRYCGEDYSDPNGVASDDYMKQGHLMMECDEVPEKVREELNGPPSERSEHADSELEGGR